MRWNKKTVFGLILTLPLILVVAWWAFYEYGVVHIETHIREATETLNKKGYDITYEDMTIGGTPFHIKAIITHPKIIDKKGLYHLESPKLIVSIHPWDYKSIQFALMGEAQLKIPSASDWKLSELSIKAGRGEIYLNEKNKVRKIKAFAEKLMPKLFGTDFPIAFHLVQGYLFNIDNPLSSGGKFSLQVTGVDTLLGVKDFSYPLNIDIKYVLSGVDDKTSISTLNQWRDMGGVLDIKDLSLSWETLQIRGDGTLTLDKKMRPLGSFSASFMGYDTTLSLLVEAGYIKKKDAQAVTFGLGLLEGKPEYGKKEIEIPVTLQKGYLRIGPAKLIKLEPIN